MEHIQTILFDLGDTLLDFGPVKINALFRQGARMAYEYLQHRGCKLPGFRYFHAYQWLAIRWSVVKGFFTGKEFNARDVLEGCCRRMKLPDDEQTIQDLCWCWYEPLRQVATVEPDLPEVLDALRSRGFKLGIISNTFVPGEILDRHLKQEGLLEFFPVRIYSCNVGHRKPDVQIFKSALQEIDGAAAETLFVGDKTETDIIGASKLGMKTALKDPNGKYRAPKPKPDFIIHAIRDLLDVLPN